MTTRSAPITTTLQAIRDHGPCEDGWRKLVKHLGGVKRVNMDALLPLNTVLEINGLASTLWCLRALAPDVRKRLTCLWLADVLDHAAEDKPNTWLTDGARLLRDYQSGKATKEELKTFRRKVAAASAYAFVFPADAAFAFAFADAAAYTAASSERAWLSYRLGQYLRGEV